VRVDLDVLRGVPEKKVKSAFARIFAEPEVPDDRGGEQFDLWTAKVSVEGGRFAPLSHSRVPWRSGR
jgi:hypothetical protein